jgi:hypothetical protein
MNADSVSIQSKSANATNGSNERTYLAVNIGNVLIGEGKPSTV